MTRSRQIDMCNGPLLKNVIAYTVPIIITSVIQLLYNAADLAVVGQFCGSKSVAAVGSTGALVTLFVNFFVGFASGAGVEMAKAVGSGNSEKVHKMVHTAMPLSMISGAVVSCLVFFLSGVMLKWMGTPDEILPLSSLYLKVYAIGLFFSLIFNFGASLLRASGDSKTPLIILSFSGIFNVVFNVIFVTAFHMDVAGVALATAISQVLSAILVIYSLMQREDAARFYFKSMKIHLEQLKNIFIIGLPSGIQSSVFALSNVLIQSSINSFGATVMSGNAASASLEGFIYVAMNGFYQAALNFTGQNMGAKKYNRISKVLVTCMSCAAVAGLVLGITMILFKNALLSIYINDSAEAIKYGSQRLVVIGTTYLLCGVMESITGVLRSIGKSVQSMIISILGVCGIRVVFILTLFKLPQFNSYVSLLLTYPVSWVVCIVIMLIVYEVEKKKLMLKLV